MNPLLVLLESELRRRVARPPVAPPADVPDVGALLALARIAGGRAGATPYGAGGWPRLPWEPKPAPPGYVEEAPEPLPLGPDHPPGPDEVIDGSAWGLGPQPMPGELPFVRDAGGRGGPFRRLPETRAPDGQTWWDYERFGPLPLPPTPPPPGSPPGVYAAYQRAVRQYERDLAAWERRRNGGTL